MENIYAIISAAVIVANIVLAIVNFITTKLKKKAVATENEELKSQLETVEGTIKLVEEIIPDAVVFAENSALSGELKELIAKSQVLLECSNKGIDYNSSEVSELIQSIIAFTKKVNYTSYKE